MSADPDLLSRGIACLRHRYPKAQQPGGLPMVRANLESKRFWLHLGKQHQSPTNIATCYRLPQSEGINEPKPTNAYIHRKHVTVNHQGDNTTFNQRSLYTSEWQKIARLRRREALLYGCPVLMLSRSIWHGLLSHKGYCQKGLLSKPL